jgi:hypothetical protein
LFAWLPVFNFLFSNAFDFIAQLYQLIFGFLDKFLRMHQPLMQQKVCEVVFESIPIVNNRTDSFRISNLTSNELKTLMNWATANRDTTEKRITPTLVSAAVVGVFANTDYFSNLITNIITKIEGFFIGPLANQPQSIAYLFVVITIIILFLIYLALLVILFENLIIQGIIIEVCIVALYAREHSDSSMSPRKRSSLFSRFLALLFSNRNR